MDIIFDKVTTETLAELEKTQKDFWNIPRKTAVLINTFIKMMGVKSALEIGTSNGYSGIWIAKALKQTGGKLTTIEFYDKRQSVAIENFKKCGVDDIVRPLQGSACDVIESFSSDEKFDFVFIDANKREYVKYFELIKPHLTEKALIVADNITSHAEKVQTFIDAVDADDEFQYEIVEVPGGILVAYRG
ncbi:class I SAM-dependent methyltransferase [bacterium]|nr:class I SAM-dependent methyltransferase [bacterium]